MSEIFLHPGEYHVGRADCRIHTVLGSCVSITLWHPIRRIGAMSHFLLANRGAVGGAGALSARYADEALSLMLSGLAGEGVHARECQAKLFGGGNMFPGRELASMESVGRKNGETARALLSAHGIPICSESLFGVGHRYIIFDVGSGDVWSRQASAASGHPSGSP
jgi:chemotaxis protein CheD